MPRWSPNGVYPASNCIRERGFELEFYLNVLDADLIIGVAIPCIFMAAKLKQKKLRLLTLLLSGFLLVHGLYHGTIGLGALPGLD